MCVWCVSFLPQQHRWKHQASGGPTWRYLLFQATQRPRVLHEVIQHTLTYVFWCLSALLDWAINVASFSVHSEKILKLATNISRDKLVSVGTCFGKFTKTTKFRLHITALDFLAPYAKVSMGASHLYYLYLWFQHLHPFLSPQLLLMELGVKGCNEDREVRQYEYFGRASIWIDVRWLLHHRVIWRAVDCGVAQRSKVAHCRPPSWFSGICLNGDVLLLIYWLLLTYASAVCHIKTACHLHCVKLV